MRKIKIAETQKVNACTLISVGVINYLLNSDFQDENILKENISKIHHENQAKVGEAVGGGMLERAAYQYYAESLLAPQETIFAIQGNNAFITNEEIEDLLAARDEYQYGSLNNAVQDEQFFQLYQQQMIRVEQALGNADPINLGFLTDWGRITATELKQQVAQQQNQNLNLDLPTLENQTHTIVNNLQNDTGITINEGVHTISLTKKNNQYYTYDSETGDLQVTAQPMEIVDYLNKKFKNAANLQVNVFNPNPNFDLNQEIEQPKEKNRQYGLTYNSLHLANDANFGDVVRKLEFLFPNKGIEDLAHYFFHEFEDEFNGGTSQKKSEVFDSFIDRLNLYDVDLSNPSSIYNNQYNNLFFSNPPLSYLDLKLDANATFLDVIEKLQQLFPTQSIADGADLYLDDFQSRFDDQSQQQKSKIFQEFIKFLQINKFSLDKNDMHEDKEINAKRGKKNI